MSKLKVLAVSVLGALSILFVSTVHAQTPAETLQQQAQERITAKCEMVTLRTETIIARYDNNKERHVNNYTRIKDRTAALMDKLDTKGYDTSVVRADLNQLDSYIKEFASEYTSFANKLRESKELACGESEGAFKNKLTEARAELAKARETSLQTRNFVQTKLRPDIQALRNQNPQPAQN